MLFLHPYIDVVALVFDCARGVDDGNKDVALITNGEPPDAKNGVLCAAVSGEPPDTSNGVPFVDLSGEPPDARNGVPFAAVSGEPPMDDDAI